MHISVASMAEYNLDLQYRHLLEKRKSKIFREKKKTPLMKLSSIQVAVTAWISASTASAKFGVTTNSKGNAFTVDTNGGLTFDVTK